MIVTKLFDYEGPLDSAKLIVDTRNAMKAFSSRRSSGSSVLTVSIHRISKVREGPPSTNLNGTYRRWEVVLARRSLARRARSAVVNPSSWTFGVATCNKYEMCAATIIRLHGATWSINPLDHLGRQSPMSPALLLPNYLFFLARFFYGLTSSEAGCCCLCQIIGHR